MKALPTKYTNFIHDLIKYLPEQSFQENQKKNIFVIIKFMITISNATIAVEIIVNITFVCEFEGFVDSKSQIYCLTNLRTYTL